MADEEKQTEGTENSEEQTQQQEEKQETKPSGQDQWDLTEQFRSELSAANKRTGTLEAELEASHKELDDLKTAQQTAAEEGQTLSTDDLDDYDKLKEHSVKLQQQLQTSQKATQNLETKLDELSTAHHDQLAVHEKKLAAIEQSEAQRVGTKMLDETCDKLDKEYGAEHRNDVLEKVGKKYKAGNVHTMNPEVRRAWIEDALELEYIKAEKSGKKKKPSDAGPGVTVDSGTGGAPPVGEIPEGSMDEVFDTYAKAQGGG